jgi:hypothetical protein
MPCAGAAFAFDAVLEVLVIDLVTVVVDMLVTVAVEVDVDVTV